MASSRLVPQSGRAEGSENYILYFAIESTDKNYVRAVNTTDVITDELLKKMKPYNPSWVGCPYEEVEVNKAMYGDYISIDYIRGCGERQEIIDEMKKAFKETKKELRIR